MCEFLRKLEIGNRVGIFQGMESFFTNFDFNKQFKNEIEDDNDKIRIQFNDTFSHKMQFYTNWSSQRPSASVGVNIIFDFFKKYTSESLLSLFFSDPCFDETDFRLF